MPINEIDTIALRKAIKLLEQPSLAARLANMVGNAVELFDRALPVGASQAIETAMTKSLEAAPRVALLTIRSGPKESSRLLHRTLAVASGVAGRVWHFFAAVGAPGFNRHHSAIDPRYPPKRGRKFGRSQSDPLMPRGVWPRWSDRDRRYSEERLFRYSRNAGKIHHRSCTFYR